MAEYLIQCKVCGNQVSNKAKVCPHCGKRLKMAVWLKIVIAIVVLGVINALIVEIGGGTSTSPKNSHSETVENTVVNEPSPEEIKNEFIATCKEYDYKEISRNPNNYLSQPCKFTGKVVQVLESGRNVDLRINVTKGSYGLWDDTIYVEYKRENPNESRILEDDIITVYGLLNGLKTYNSVLKTISIPLVEAKYIELKE